MPYIADRWRHVCVCMCIHHTTKQFVIQLRYDEWLIFQNEHVTFAQSSWFKTTTEQKSTHYDEPHASNIFIYHCRRQISALFRSVRFDLDFTKRISWCTLEIKLQERWDRTRQSSACIRIEWRADVSAFKYICAYDLCLCVYEKLNVVGAKSHQWTNILLILWNETTKTKPKTTERFYAFHFSKHHPSISCCVRACVRVFLLTFYLFRCHKCISFERYF